MVRRIVKKPFEVSGDYHTTDELLFTIPIKPKTSEVTGIPRENTLMEEIMTSKPKSNQRGEAVRELYKLHKDGLTKFCIFIGVDSPDLQEDLITAVFIDLLQRDIEFDESKGKVRSFLDGMLVNHYKMYERARKRRVFHEHRAGRRKLVGVERDDPTLTDSMDIEAFGELTKLPPRLSEYLAYHMDGLSTAEIAKKMGVSESAVWQHKHRVKGFLRKFS